jgi:hypothetical protein
MTAQVRGCVAAGPAIQPIQLALIACRQNRGQAARGITAPPAEESPGRQGSGRPIPDGTRFPAKKLDSAAGGRCESSNQKRGWPPPTVVANNFRRRSSRLNWIPYRSHEDYQSTARAFLPLPRHCMSQGRDSVAMFLSQNHVSIGQCGLPIRKASFILGSLPRVRSSIG